MRYAFLHGAIILASFIFLSGCAPSTLEGLKEKGQKKEFVTDLNYQQTHKNILSYLNKCMIKGAMMAQTNIQPQLYTDLEEGVIRASYNNMGDVDVHFYSSVIPNPEGEGSLVTAYAANIKDHLMDELEGWARGATSKCP